MTDNARSRALLILSRWEKERVPLDLVTTEVLRPPFSEPRDLQFCRALVYGVVCWRGYLDALLMRYSTHQVAQMKPLTRQALRCGLYQLVAMDRVPASAAINATVQLLKEAGQPRWLTGFVNGVLRRVSRELAKFPHPGEIGGGNTVGWAVPDLLSHPRWLYERWVGRHGETAALSLCRANNEGAPLVLRAVPRIGRGALLERLQGAGIIAEAGGFAPTAVVLPGYRGAVPNLPGYEEGWFQVQDEAAQLVVPLLGELCEGLWLDACAGLGGKTTQLAELAGVGVKLVAVEPEARRFELLGENLQRVGLGAKVERFSGTIAALVTGGDRQFQGILVDAPCSGLGVIRRHPDIRWNRREEELIRYQSGQLALLGYAAALLRPGGVLVYATCSTEPEENEQVVERFLAEHQDFRIEKCGEYLPLTARNFVGADGLFRTRPDQGLDGFFAARLVKK
ncbi:MAG: 16S rRNA (cytosine(967)-C(5))-methyltransferase RsmB [Desulfobulbaceae bacterium]|nr:16S rRNA (cytosine(967)-C(5))-methyltransferase RsmB [Desulfobulbaceae bacterium]